MNPSLNAFRPGRLLVAASLTASLLSLSVQAATLTRDNGAPVGDNQNSQTAGPNGSVLLQDVQLLQKLQRFDRERIPERVVHARGTGAHGEFVASADISDLSMAKVFRKGEKTPVFVRFSAVVHGNHSRKPCAIRAVSPPSSIPPTAIGTWWATTSRPSSSAMRSSSRTWSMPSSRTRAATSTTTRDASISSPTCRRRPAP